MLLNYVPCQNCFSPIADLEWVVKQAKRNLHSTKHGVSLHYFTCPQCRKKWAVIVLADQEMWGFLTIQAEAGEHLYQKVLQMRENQMSVEQIKKSIFTQGLPYIS